MRRRIILATRNQGKIRELEALVQGFNLQVQITGLDEFPGLLEVEETGSTFEENALLKARYTSKATGLVALADDSGLEVEALNGEPGVYSARFYLKHPLPAGAKQAAQEKTLSEPSPCEAPQLETSPLEPSPSEPSPSETDALNIACLLSRLQNVPAGLRQARFCCAIAAVSPDGDFITAFGAWPGVIIKEAAGANGFGYDPVFFDQELKLTAAQMSPALKNTRSHRHMALQNLRKLWPDFWRKVSGQNINQNIIQAHYQSHCPGALSG
jgi:XTP/dITP diphosphohydrolase